MFTNGLNLGTCFNAFFETAIYKNENLGTFGIHVLIF